jgi:hypothetical protein
MNWLKTLLASLLVIAALMTVTGTRADPNAGHGTRTYIENASTPAPALIMVQSAPHLSQSAIFAASEPVDPGSRPQLFPRRAVRESSEDSIDGGSSLKRAFLSGLIANSLGAALMWLFARW